MNTNQIQKNEPFIPLNRLKFIFISTLTRFMENSRVANSKKKEMVDEKKMPQTYYMEMFKVATRAMHKYTNPHANIKQKETKSSSWSFKSSSYCLMKRKRKNNYCEIWRWVVSQLFFLFFSFFFTLHTTFMHQHTYSKQQQGIYYVS